MASPRSPPTSRCAVRPGRYVTGKTSLGAKKRKAVTTKLTPMRTPTTIALGGSTPRWRRASATITTAIATTLGHQRVQGDDREAGEREHLDGRHRPAAPASPQGDTEGTRGRGHVVQARGHQLGQLGHEQVD